jgi:trimethylamine--corrinoid protein Co-methyltransferase
MNADPVNTASQIGRPRVLSDADIGRIHGVALQLVESVGMRIGHPRSLELLAGAGCAPADGVVKLPARLVEELRKKVPSSVSVFDRDGRAAMTLGGYNSYFGSGSDLMSTWDLETGELRPSSLADTRRAARLCDALPNISFVMSSAWPNELEPSFAFLQNFRAMVQNTRKPLVVTCEGLADLSAMWRIASAVRGDAEALAARPYFISYTESVSPLAHMDESLDKLLFCADVGVPTLYTPAPLAGATAPVTLPGLLAQGLAEYYQGMVVHQLARPGAPLIYGIGPLMLDFATMQSSYCGIEVSIGHTASIELARWLDVPNWAYGGMTDAHCVDAQAGLEMAHFILLNMLCGSNLTHDVGYEGFGLEVSLEQMVIADEYIGMDRRLLAGLTVDEDELAADVIAEVGPGGNFIGHRHTRSHYRAARYQPVVMNRSSREAWDAEGRPDVRERARRRALDLLASHEVPPLPEDVAEAIDAIVQDYEETDRTAPPVAH